MNRTERLLDLIAFLLNASRPVTFAEIQESFPGGYEGNYEAAIRKFERDKDTLLDLGIPVRYVAPEDEDGAEAGGYVIDRDTFYLPEIDLTPAEMAVVFLAGSAVLGQGEFPYRRDLERALHKVILRTEIPGQPPTERGVLLHHPALAGGPLLADRLGVIERAMSTRKRLWMVYNTQHSGEQTERNVDPYGLFCKEGRWSLVGYCHTREAIRVFSIHRIDTLDMNTRKPATPDFEVPADFRLADYKDVPPWKYDRHAPMTVQFEVTEERAWMARQHFGLEGAASDPGWVGFELETTHAEAILEWVLRMGASARLVGPEAVRQQVVDRLQTVLARYGGAA